jgi:hypothetical protein
LVREEEAGPLTLHLPQVSKWDSVWTVPFSLAATMGIPCLVSFPPPTKMLPFGGLPLREGAYSRKSHSGILGSMAACAYPRRYRGLPRPSSALKPSHSPDSVACSGRGGVCLAFGETCFYYVLRVVVCVWCHVSDVVSVLIYRFTPIWLGGGLHVVFCFSNFWLLDLS